MRIKSAIFVSAIIRQETANGAFAMVLQKGAEDAGAIFFVHLKTADTHDFYAPAPQSFIEDALPLDRAFELISSDLTRQEVQSKIDTQLRFDPDCWVVEIEKPEPITSFKIIDTQ